MNRMMHIKLLSYLNNSYSQFFRSSSVYVEEGTNFIIINLSNKFLIGFLSFLKNDTALNFFQLIDNFAIDNLFSNNFKRFELLYYFINHEQNIRLVIRTFGAQETIFDSIMSIYPTANWFEREIWDMYGLVFLGHNDLRRILTNYGFEGHPLRKDFPLSGFTEVRYDSDLKLIVEEPLALTQEFRYFDFTTPWDVEQKQTIIIQ